MVVEGVCCHSCSSLLNRLVFDLGKELSCDEGLARKCQECGIGCREAAVAVNSVQEGD